MMDEADLTVHRRSQIFDEDSEDSKVTEHQFGLDFEREGPPDLSKRSVERRKARIVVLRHALVGTKLSTGHSRKGRLRTTEKS